MYLIGLYKYILDICQNKKIGLNADAQVGQIYFTRLTEYRYAIIKMINNKKLICFFFFNVYSMPDNPDQL